MKKFIIISIMLFIIICAGLLFFILTFDANRYNSLLTQKIEDAIGKDVKIGNISLSFLPSLGLKVDGVSVKDKDKTWQEAVLKAASIEASVKPLPLIRKDIQIEHLRIRGLDLIITRESLEAPSDSVNTTDGMDMGLATAGALKFLAKSITITDSSVKYQDKLSETPIDLEVGIIEAFLKNISLYGPVNIEARMSMFGRGAENIRLKGVLYPEIELKTPYIKNLEAVLNLGKINFINALSALGIRPADIQQIIGKEFSGELLISSDKFYFDKRRIFDSSVYVSLHKGTVDLVPIEDKIKDVEISAEMTKGNLFIQEFTGQVAKGSFSAKGIIEGITSHRSSDLEIDFKDLEVSHLLPDVPSGKPRFEGNLNMELHSTARGLALEGLLDTLTAKGVIRLDNGILKNMNILTVALDKIDILPGLIEKLKARLPEYYKELLKQNYTAFKPFETEFDIENRKLVFNRATVESDAFYLAGNGYLGLNGEIDFRSSLFIPPDLSDAFTGAVREFEYLKNTKGMITMPIDIYGRFPDVSVSPDLDYVIRKLAVTKGQELLDAIFKKERPETIESESGTTESKGESTTQEEGAGEEQEELKPAEALIRTIFDIITAPKEGDYDESDQ